ncbi:hypothetical protein LOC67_14460 [Stieleria sp. JC731]|uniref:WD40 repeat domain-containing protein n=1 Tax=Pirellulaceae TaxID=2691357 RepID=UPI001E586221|nr:hypothetical protein [Stieleria sp. JC731]MCC9601759.1 hypothetical protein [Stieleria sp. JC731]
MKIFIHAWLPLWLVVAGAVYANADDRSGAAQGIDVDSIWVTSIDHLDGDRFVAGTASGLLLQPANVVSFDSDHPDQLTNLYEHPAAVWTVATSSDGKTIASVDYKGNLVVYDVDSATPTTHPNAFERWCQKIIVSADGKSVIAGNEAGKVFVWDLSESKVSKSLELGKASITCIALAPNGQGVAASDGEGKVHLISWPAFEVIGAISVSNETAWCIAYENESTLLVGSGDRNLYRVEATPDSKPVSLAVGTDWITRLAVSPSGSIAASEVSGKIHLVSGGEATTLEAYSGVWSLDFSNPGRLFVGTRKDGINVAKQTWSLSAPATESGEATQ